ARRRVCPLGGRRTRSILHRSPGQGLRPGRVAHHRVRQPHNRRHLQRHRVPNPNRSRL
ncbi:uncharacterized protein METZ01_LOCUS229791, partial [marine metagenome]